MRVRTAVHNFWISLQQFGELQGMYGNPEMDAAYEALVNEFLHWFQQFEQPTKHGQPAKTLSLPEAIHRYCDPNTSHCPICGRQMVTKVNTTTKKKFLGCCNYPTCCGARDEDGRISVNSALRAFLLEKMISRPEPKVELTRFDMIETGNE